MRHYLKDCKLCRLWKAQACKQLMAPLPKCRVSAGNPPFTCTGVDYFGPILIKVGRSHVKRYGCLFTCMASRAIHIEIANSLNASSFLQAFFRFIHRRGRVKEMYSDRGSNFVLAERELREEIQRWNQQEIHSSLRQKGVTSYCQINTICYTAFFIFILVFLTSFTIHIFFLPPCN